MEDNRFLRCVAEHRAEVRKWDKDTHTRDIRTWDIGTPQTSDSTRETPRTKETEHSTRETTVYYSTRETSQPRSVPTESFEERYNRIVAAQKAAKAAPASPGFPTQRKRQDSFLSIQSEESFPSLPSSKSTPNTPKMMGMSWSETLKKGLEEGDSIKRRQKPRVQSYTEDEEAWEEEGDIVFDEDGFPHIRASM